MEYYSVKEIADLLSVNEETVRRWIRDNKLDAERGSGRQGSKITSEALVKFLDENKGLMTSVAAQTLGLTTLIAGSVVGGIASPLAAGLIAGVSWISILKNKNKDKKTIRLELMEKEIELEGIAMNLKNEIASKQNELELIENQITKLTDLIKNLES